MQRNEDSDAGQILPRPHCINSKDDDKSNSNGQKNHHRHEDNNMYRDVICNKGRPTPCQLGLLTDSSRRIPRLLPTSRIRQPQRRRLQHRHVETIAHHDSN